MTTDLTQEFDRAEPSNPFNYSKLDLAKREKDVKSAMRDYPHIPSFYIEMAYDVVANTEEQEMNDIIENDLWVKYKKKLKK